MGTDVTTNQKRAISMALVALCDDSPLQYRTKYNGIPELAEAVKKWGILQPLTVRIVKEGRFEVVFGHRRIRAAVAAGLESVPVEVRELTDDQVIDLQLIENAHREDAHPVDQAMAYKRIIERHQCTILECAKRVAMSESHVRQRLSLCALAPSVLKATRDNTISIGVATLIAAIEGEQQQVEALDEVQADGGMTVVAAREWLRGEYTLQLKDAPFSRSSKLLVVGTPACNACPKRTMAQASLFGGTTKAKDACLDVACWQRKCGATYELEVTRAEKNGAAIVDDERSRAAFSTHGGMSHAWVRADDTTWLGESETKTTWRNVAEPAGVPLHLLRDHNGAPVYAYHRADAERACKQAEMAEETAKASEGKATDSKTKPADSMPSMTAEEQADAEKAKRKAERDKVALERAIRDRVLQDLADAAEHDTDADGHVDDGACARALCHQLGMDRSSPHGGQAP